MAQHQQDAIWAALVAVMLLQPSWPGLACRCTSTCPPDAQQMMACTLQELRELIARCWAPNPEDRPAFVQLVKELEVSAGICFRRTVLTL